MIESVYFRHEIFYASNITYLSDIEVSLPFKKETNQLQLYALRGANKDKSSFSTSFFVSPLSKTLTASVKTRIGVVNEKVATLPFSKTKTIFSKRCNQW